MSTAASRSPASRRAADAFTPSTVRFSSAVQPRRPRAVDSSATVVIVVSTQTEQQDQLTQSLLNRGYRLQNETEPGSEPGLAASVLEDIYSTFGGRLASDGRLPTVLVEAESTGGRRDQREVLSIGNLRLDRRRREVRLADDLIVLTKTEFDILYLLARERGIVFTRDEIVTAVKGQGHPVTPRSVDVQLVSLRRKLGSFGQRLETVRGVGYRFAEVQ